jgi:hypothetical protein
VIAAACERIFPSDENGPGAKEAAAIVYIDRQPAGPYGLDRHRCGKGLSWNRFRSTAMPEVDFSSVEIQTFLPGASPETMSQLS